MSFTRKLRKKLEKGSIGKKAAVNKFHAMEELISRNMMMVVPEKYYVAMLEELWNMYGEENKTDFCENILYYCNLKNSFAQIAIPENPTLTISIKYPDDEVRDFAAYSKGKIYYA
jgi:hypothetical protein